MVQAIKLIYWESVDRKLSCAVDNVCSSSIQDKLYSLTIRAQNRTLLWTWDKTESLNKQKIKILLIEEKCIPVWNSFPIVKNTLFFSFRANYVSCAECYVCRVTGGRGKFRTQSEMSGQGKNFKNMHVKHFSIFLKADRVWNDLNNTLRISNL